MYNAFARPRSSVNMKYFGFFRKPCNNIVDKFMTNANFEVFSECRESHLWLNQKLKMMISFILGKAPEESIVMT